MEIIKAEKFSIKSEKIFKNNNYSILFISKAQKKHKY